MKFVYYLFIVFNILHLNAYQEKFDLTIIGSINFSGSLARISIGILNLFKNDLKINFIPTIENNFLDIPLDVKKIIKKNCLVPGKVSLFTEVLWLPSPKMNELYKKVPNSEIKIAYSMLESTAIPPIWVKILNSNFDSVVVPDKFLIEVYKNSGVKIPIFELPIGLFLEDFLRKPEKKIPNKIFVFGCSAVGWQRKNLDLLIKSFSKAFKNNNNVILKIHSKCARSIQELRKIINQIKARNIYIINQNLNWSEYVNLFSSFDCYVLLSKGEGFSITPREALALGIPCIITNNTAHKTICESGYVYTVTSNIQEPSYYDVFGRIYGVHFNCKMNDVVYALQEVYRNYKPYLEKAKKGRIWVQQYLYKNLKNKYLNLIKPKKVILGTENKITNDYLMTNSSSLYKKYLNIIKK